MSKIARNRLAATKPMLLLTLGLALALTIIVVLAIRAALAPTPAPTTPGLATIPAGASSEAASRPIDTINAALAAADEYLRNGQYVNAGVILDRATAKFPDDRQIREVYAAALLGQQRYPEALTQLEEALRIGPPSVKLYMDAGVVANQAGKTDRAAELLNLGALKDPNEPQLPLYLAMVQIKQGNDAAATASLVKALRLKDDLPEAWGTLAELALKTNDLSLAKQHVAKARALQPDNLRWRNTEARIAKREGNPRAAIDLLQAFDPEDLYKANALTTLADALAMDSKPLAAARLYSNAAINIGTDGELYYQAAIFFQKAGDASMARSSARLALDLKHAKAKEFLDGLKN